MDVENKYASCRGHDKNHIPCSAYLQCVRSGCGLGLGDLDFESSTVGTILLGLIGIWYGCQTCVNNLH